jgi:hypothetical protein
MSVLIARDASIEHFVQHNNNDDDQDPQPPIRPKPLTRSLKHARENNLWRHFRTLAHAIAFELGPQFLRNNQAMNERGVRRLVRVDCSRRKSASAHARSRIRRVGYLGLQITGLGFTGRSSQAGQRRWSSALPSESRSTPGNAATHVELRWWPALMP